MDYLDKRYTLDLMLVIVRSSKNYYNKLKKMAVRRKNVRFIPPVPYRNLIDYTNKYDIGIFLLPPTNFNLKYALPNKFFEFIQARLAIAIGPSIEMEKIVRKYDLGVVAKDFTPKAMAKEINKLSFDKIQYYKNQANKYAMELSSENNRIKILKIAEDLIEE